MLFHLYMFDRTSAGRALTPHHGPPSHGSNQRIDSSERKSHLGEGSIRRPAERQAGALTTILRLLAAFRFE